MAILAAAICASLTKRRVEQSRKFANAAEIASGVTSPANEQQRQHARPRRDGDQRSNAGEPGFGGAAALAHIPQRERFIRCNDAKAAYDSAKADAKAKLNSAGERASVQVQCDALIGDAKAACTNSAKPTFAKK